MFGGVVEGLVEVREAMEHIAGAFDRRDLTPAECRRVVAEASKIERLAATVKALAGSRAS